MTKTLRARLFTAMIGLAVAATMTAIAVMVVNGLLFAREDVPPEQSMLATSGQEIRDSGADGRVTALRGTNLGGWLVQEGWMSPAGEAALGRQEWRAWAATQWDQNDPAAAIDSSAGSRWWSGREQAVNDALVIDFGSRITFDTISVDAGGDDVPDAFEIRVSDDSVNWRTVGTAGAQVRAAVSTGYQSGRFLSLTITEPARGRWWSVADVSAFVSDDYSTRRVLTERFGDDTAQELLSAYQDAWFQESDLDEIAALGFTLVRVPVTWQLFATDAWTWRTDEQAFGKLDWLIEQSALRGIYVMIDMHATPGAHCPWHSCGRAGTNMLWTDSAAQDLTVEIWERIAARYSGNPTVAAYDLLNEPQIAMDGAESDDQIRQKFDFYDRLYSAVRAVDPDHMIAIMAFPEPDRAPHPSGYG